MRCIPLSLALLLTPSCVGPAAVNPPNTIKDTTTTSSSSTTTTRLFSLDVEGDHCHARVRTLAQTVELQTLFTTTTATCPTAIVFDTPRARVLGIDGGTVVAWDNAGVRTVLATAPAPTARLTVSPTGAVRAAWLAMDGLSSDDANSTLHFEAHDAVDGDNGFPREVAVLAELNGSTWLRLQAVPTTAEAGDTPGLSVLTSVLISPAGVVVVGERASAMRCGVVVNCEQVTPDLKKRIGDAADNVGLLQHGSGVLAWPVIWGDAPHAFAPVSFCSDASCASKTIVLEKTNGDRQLALATQGGFALIAGEYANDNAVVLDAAGSTVLTLPTSSSVVFLP